MHSSQHSSIQLTFQLVIGMVFEHLWDLFDPKDLANGF
jgi:hypothetical protein